jgi:hypothetical protein
LTVPGKTCADFFEKLSENFPNLKELTVNDSNQKLNFFAKQFKNIEKLSICQKISWLYELDAGIVNLSVKELKLNIYHTPGDRHLKPPLLDVCGIFPNLEAFQFKGYYISLESSLNFFDEYHHLKSFQLDELDLLKFTAVVEDLKPFMRRVEKIEFGIYFNEQYPRESRQFAWLQRKFKGQFKFEKQMKTDCAGKVRYRMIKLEDPRK